MTANDSTPGSGESASEIATNGLSEEEQRVADRLADVYHDIHVRLMDAPGEIEKGEADRETVERLREAVDEVSAAVDDLAELVEEE